MLENSKFSIAQLYRGQVILIVLESVSQSVQVLRRHRTNGGVGGGIGCEFAFKWKWHYILLLCTLDWNRSIRSGRWLLVGYISWSPPSPPPINSGLLNYNLILRSRTAISLYGRTNCIF